MLLFNAPWLKRHNKRRNLWGTAFGEDRLLKSPRKLNVSLSRFEAHVPKA